MSRPEYEVRLFRIADDDLLEIIAFVAADRASAAETVLSKMEKNLTLLIRQPRLGRNPKEEDLARLGYRYLVVDTYLVFYAVEERTIFAHRILHGAQDYLRL